MHLSHHVRDMSKVSASTLLIVDDEIRICSSLKRLFTPDGYTIHIATSPAEAMDVLSCHVIDVVISDQRMPEELGTHFLNRVQQSHPNTIRIILSGYSDITDITKAMDAGVIYKFLTKPWDNSLLRANIREAFHRAHELAKISTDNSQSPFVDSVTGLGNRQYLANVYTPLVEDSIQQGRQLVLAALCLDQYELVRNHLGECSSQGLIKTVAKVLSTVLYVEAELAYIGEGVFCILLTDIDIDTCVKRIAEHLRHAFANTIRHENYNMRMTFTIGADYYSLAEYTFEKQLENARIALCDAMTLGQGGMRVYHPDISVSGKRIVTIENDIYHALEQQQFTLAYQPQIALASGRISGFEALIRWHHPELGIVSPVEFIPICEKKRLIIDIGLWVFDEALRQFNQWKPYSISSKLLSVNVSPVQMLEPNLPDKIAELLKKHQFPAENIVLEITETADLVDPQISKTLLALNKLGVALAIDDFGTGYANFTHLTQLPISKVKIDRSLIQSTALGGKHRRLFDQIVNMSCDLGFETVVEGVETSEELAIAAQAKCHTIQGYFYSPPLSAVQCQDLINNQF